jgi:hypothetical protein
MNYVRGSLDVADRGKWSTTMGQPQQGRVWDGVRVAGMGRVQDGVYSGTEIVNMRTASTGAGTRDSVQAQDEWTLGAASVSGHKDSIGRWGAAGAGTTGW